MYPEDIAEATGLELGTVKNALTKLRKAGKVQPTGNTSGRGGSEEVRLAELSSLLLPLEDSYSDSSQDSQPSQEELVRTAYGEMDNDVPFE